MNGIYTLYLTGKAGSSMAMIMLLDGRIRGSDFGGSTLSGEYNEAADGISIEGNIHFSLPRGHTSILGITAEETDIEFDVPIKIPKEIESMDFIRVETPAGPVNVTMKKVGDVEFDS